MTESLPRSVPGGAIFYYAAKSTNVCEGYKITLLGSTSASNLSIFSRISSCTPRTALRWPYTASRNGSIIETTRTL